MSFRSVPASAATAMVAPSTTVASSAITTATAATTSTSPSACPGANAVRIDRLTDRCSTISVGERIIVVEEVGRRSIVADRGLECIREGSEAECLLVSWVGRCFDAVESLPPARKS